MISNAAQNKASQDCFLCRPEKTLVYEGCEFFYACLGLGAITEGYSILATREHVPSMFDLSRQAAENLAEFTSRVRQTLSGHYGSVIFTEHGRVPACDYLDASGREGHCFHGHRLVFPLNIDLTDSFTRHDFKFVRFSSYLDALSSFSWQGEYLYFEKIDGSCLIAPAKSRLVRQFFRFEVAERIGHAEYANWKLYPRVETILIAAKKLKVSL